MISDLRQHNIDHIRTLFKASRNPHPVLIIVQRLSTIANAINEAVKNGDPSIIKKPEGYLYDGSMSYPDKAAGTNDVFKARIGMTDFGYTAIIDGRFWITLSQEEHQQAVGLIKSGATMRYHNDYDQWIDGLINNDRDHIVRMFAGIVSSGLRDSKNKSSMYATVDSSNHMTENVNMAVPDKGSTDVTVNQRLSSVITTMQTGGTARMECRFSASLSCAYIVGTQPSPTVALAGLRQGGSA